jgi:vacuolar-type H+-ATPase subunit H
MRIIPFPADEPLPGQEAWTANLEAALRGESEGPAADAWRELRGDVRSLAPAMTPAFEGSLAQGLERLGALQGVAVDADTQPRSEDSPDTAGGISEGDAPALRPGAFARLRSGPRSLASHRRSAVAAAATAAVALVAALLIAGPHGSGPVIESAPVERTPAVARGTSGHSPNVTSRGSSTSATSPEAQHASPLVGAPSAAGAASAPGRVQQLAASVTLGSTPASLQAISDQVAQLAVRDGGYVQSSNVQVQQQGASEATLALRLPSARLGAALAAIGRLAPIRAENQSLQDITDAYDAARQQLSDAEAERRALLRALATATTEGQIDSLRERLSASRAAIARAHSSVNAVSQRASTAEVEVSILGDARAGSEGLTLHRGLHDAGRVLVVALIVILIAASILVPLALVLAALAGASSAWRRYRRERVLNGH